MLRKPHYLQKEPQKSDTGAIVPVENAKAMINYGTIMTSLTNIRFSSIAILCIGLLAGCGGPRTALQGKPYFSVTAGDVFKVGYASITEKYIKDIAVSDVALKGMQGLVTLEPELSVQREGESIILSINGDTVRVFALPKEGVVEDWAILTASLVDAGRRVSENLQVASSEAIYQAVFDGSLSGLDRFTRYSNAKAARRNRARRDGFGGIGVRFKAWGRGGIVQSVKAKLPADLAGVKAGDHFTHVGGVYVSGLSNKEISARLRGPVSSLVSLTVNRDGSPQSLKFEIKRVLIIPNTVAYGFKDGVAIIKISGFNKNTAKSLRSSIKKALADHGNEIKGVVLDLRGNPGGLLKQAIKVVDVFLPQGDIINTKGRHPHANQHYESDGADLTEGLPLILLVDGKSASSAEVVAASLQDQGRAVVIGTSSFGKGTVQTVIRLPNTAEITLTWSRLIAPSGYAFHNLGILPTICTSGERDSNKFAMNDPDVRHKTASTWGAWRHVDFDDKKKRKELRNVCPPERRKKAVDVDVARRLLENSSLFARTIDFMSVTEEAGSP